jgi:hypothetical protein
MAERAIILIPDISGFTGFTGATEIDHAAHIITELLELIVASNETDFTLAEIEGDAVLFYRKGEPLRREQLVDQCLRMFANFAHLARAAGDLGVELVPFEAESPDEIGRTLAAIAVAKVEAVNVLASPRLNGSRGLIIERMRDHRLPAIYQWPESAEDGGLLAYGPRNLLCYRHIVSLVDKVLRGGKPADLPIEQPTKFELVVNLKTANALGITISPTLLLRADEVIE